MRIDMCVNMCIDMCFRYASGHASRHVCRHVSRHVYKHVYDVAIVVSECRESERACAWHAARRGAEYGMHHASIPKVLLLYARAFFLRMAL